MVDNALELTVDEAHELALFKSVKQARPRGRTLPGDEPSYGRSGGA